MKFTSSFLKLPKYSLVTGTLLVCFTILFSPHLYAGEPEKTGKEYWYHYILNGVKIGYYHERVSEPDPKTGNIRFTFDWNIIYNNQTITMKSEVLAKNNLYRTPLYIKNAGNAEENMNYTAELKGSDLLIKANGYEAEKLAIPTDSVFEPVCFDITRNLHTIRNPAPFRFTSLSMGGPELSRNHELAFSGNSTFTVNGKSYDCRKFILRGESISPAGLWLDSEGFLVRIEMDGRKNYILTTEKEAINMLTPVIIGEKKSPVK